MANIDMNHVVSELKTVSKLYEKYFLGKAFIFIDEDESFEEVFFVKEDFAHLTGVNSNLTDADFYKKCIRKTLQPTEISFTQRYDYKSHKKKMYSFKKANKLVDGTFNNTRGLYNVVRKKGTFPYAIADFDTTLCFCYKKHSKDQMLHPKSMRREIISNYQKNKRIILIAEKNDISDLYKKINFGHIGILEHLPKSLKTYFDIEAITKKV